MTDPAEPALPAVSTHIDAHDVMPEVFGPSDDTIVRFQGDIEKLMTPALRTLHELCEMADSEGVRLNAATSILYFAGLRPHKRRWQPVQDEGARAEGTGRELALLLERLEKNRPGITEAVAQAAAEEIDDVIDVDPVE
jgi:hypothetical protein